MPGQPSPPQQLPGSTTVLFVKRYHRDQFQPVMYGGVFGATAQHLRQSRRGSHNLAAVRTCSFEAFIGAAVLRCQLAEAIRVEN